MTSALIVSTARTEPSACRLQRLAELIGIDTALATTHELKHEAPSQNGRPDCILISASALQELLCDHNDPIVARQRLLEGLRSLFVFAFSDDPKSVQLAALLTNDAVSGVVRLPYDHAVCTISRAHSKLTREFTGLRIDTMQCTAACGFSMTSAAASDLSIAEANGHPFLICNETDGVLCVLSGMNHIADVNERVVGNLEVETYFASLVPALMLLKHTFGQRCWHSPHPWANLIIDDPLIRPSYGFLNYEDLLHELGQHNFAMTTAFIPFNHDRSHEGTASLFRAHQDRLSICVHGLDHTKHEFATDSLGDLNAMVQEARSRMMSHHKRTGVDYSEVMVFPHGWFSSNSLRVLRDNNYLAAANSTVVPQGDGAARDLTLADHMAPAIVAYFGFPLFFRRYPGQLASHAFDLFLEKPLLLVDHHEAFREGYGALADFVGEINGLREDLSWCDLQTGTQRSYRQRWLNENEWALVTTARRQTLLNTGEVARLYHILIDMPRDSVPDRVSVDGEPIALPDGEDDLVVSQEIGAGAQCTVEFILQNPLGTSRLDRAVRDRAVIRGRRYLTEFRDNVLSKHDRLLALAEKGRGLLR